MFDFDRQVGVEMVPGGSTHGIVEFGGVRRSDNEGVVQGDGVDAVLPKGEHGVPGDVAVDVLELEACAAAELVSDGMVPRFQASNHSHHAVPGQAVFLGNAIFLVGAVEDAVDCRFFGAGVDQGVQQNFDGFPVVVGDAWQGVEVAARRGCARQGIEHAGVQRNEIQLHNGQAADLKEPAILAREILNPMPVEPAPMLEVTVEHPIDRVPRGIDMAAMREVDALFPSDAQTDIRCA